MGGIAGAKGPAAPQPDIEAETADWVQARFDAARPGEQFVYARGRRGAVIAKPPAGMLAVRRLLDAGLVLTFQRSAGTRTEYIAQRRATPERKPTGAATRLIGLGRAEIDDDCGDLLAELKRRARHGQACGTNRDLGEALGGISPDRVSYLFKKLQKAERISVNSSGDERVVTIAGTALRTAANAGAGR